MGSLLRYSLLRLSLLAAVALVAYVAGARGLTLVVVAFIGSGVVSLVLLRAPREDVAQKLAERADPSRPRRGLFARINERIEAANRAEDEALETDSAGGTAVDGTVGERDGSASADPRADRDVDPDSDEGPQR